MYPIEFFYRAALRWPDRVAVEKAEKYLSYRELLHEVEALATALQGIDPTPSSRVGICCYNHIEHLIAWLAVLASGKTWVPLYPKHAKAELEANIAFTEASIIVADEENLALLAQVDAETIVATPRDDTMTTGGLRRKYAGRKPAFHPLPLHETQAIKFTGGTTGKPKGVMQPYRAWNANIVTQITAWNMEPGDRYLAAAPITHGTSTYLLPTLATGGTVCLVDRPRPEETLRLLAEQEITTTFVPPTVIYTMMQLDAVRELRFPRLRNLVYGAGPMRSEAIAQAQALFGPVLASTYGQTEAPQIATCISAADMARPEKRASVGRETILAKVGIMDEKGGLLPRGEHGEIVIRGDLVMTGYWKQPEKTAETIKEGWLHTGDLGAFDEEGFLFIKGRSKDVIITGGFNVYPIDVEPVIADFPGVVDCAVFGVSDEKWGEAVHAAVEVSTGASATEADIIGFVKERLGSVKAPKSVTFYNRLPRNPFGKLQKQKLIADFETKNTARNEENS